MNVSPAVRPEDIRIWTWSALARSAKAINYYAWYPMSTGYESGGFGLIQLDGTLTERSRTAGAIARIVDRNQKLFLEARPPKAQVAIVYNPLSYLHWRRQRQAAYGGPQGEVTGIERDSMMEIYRALFPSNVPLDFLHVNRLSEAALRQYKLVLLPYPLMLPSSTAAPLKEYVRNGGALVTEARLGWNNESGAASPVIPGMGLHEVMGCRETAVQTGGIGPHRFEWTGTDLPGFGPGERLQARWYEETLEPPGAQARVAAEFPDGRAAAVISKYGKGKTLMLGSYAGAAYETRRDPAAPRFYLTLLAWAGVDLPIKTEAGAIEVRYLESGSDRLAFAFNHGKQSVDVSISLKLPGHSYRGSDLVTGKPVQALEDAGLVKFRGHIAAEDVWVVLLSPRS